MATTTVEGGRPSLSLAIGRRLTTTAWSVLAVAIALMVWQLGAVAFGSPFFPGPVKSAAIFR
jgi:hypothetical protein